VLQLRASQRQARAGFEDALNQQYRDLVAALPVEAFLTPPDTTVQEAAWQPNLATFYRYADLCNEQVFLRQRGRVSRETWNDWRAGISTT
jgi:hypothetical protein